MSATTTVDGWTAALRGPDFQSAEEVGVKVGITAEAASQRLRRAYKRGDPLERHSITLYNGNIQYMWRALPAGYLAPLYDAQPGIDGRALDSCLGGYTYRKAKSNTENHINER